MEALLDSIGHIHPVYISAFVAVMRFAAPALAAIILWRCCKGLLTFKKEPEVWAWLQISGGKKVPVTHWENVIGRSKRSDIVIDFPTVSRTHAVLTRYDDGSWSIADVDSKDGVYVGGKKVNFAALRSNDTISLGGVQMQLQPMTHKQEKKMAKLRRRDTDGLESVATLLLLSVFQALTCIGYLMNGSRGYSFEILCGFGGLMLAQWALLLFYLAIRRPAFELETLAFFLCSMGMAAIAAVKPEESVKQLIAIVLGLTVFLLAAWSMRDLERAKKMRYVAAVTGILLLLVTLLFGKEYYGAKNWLVLGPLSIQPSELCKVCFVYVGASAMDNLLKKRNIFFFIVYTLTVCACLGLMNDFGTAFVFFVAFLIIAYLRSGDVGTVGLALTALGFAGTIGLKLAPHALKRFSSWRHIWEDPLGGGYQQTRALMCLASGGLFGIGIGEGKMFKIFAADSDVVFATISEEWGLVMALMVVVAVAVPAVFAIRSAKVSRSSFYAIGACTAGGILLVQTIFNVLGTVDVLPLTGVTMPFVSNGGSSMICVWGLLAFIKAADTRQYASFAVRTDRRRIR